MICNCLILHGIVSEMINDYKIAIDLHGCDERMEYLVFHTSETGISGECL